MSFFAWFARHIHHQPTDEASLQALAESEQTLAAAQARRPEVEAVAERLRKHRTDNHFAEITVKALGAHRD